METKTERRLFNVREAARYLSVSVSTLYGWVWQRRIPFVKVGRSLRFDENDLENFIRANRYEARTQAEPGTRCRELSKIRGAAGKG